MINPPNTICSMELIIVASIMPWNTLLPRAFSTTGKSKINAAPINAPEIVPSPPMIAINIILNDRLILKAANGSIVFKYV